MNYNHYFIYRTTCLIDGKIYVGVHSTNNLDDGYLGSGKHLRRAIDKHGVENFTREILAFYSSAEEAYLAESKTVTEDFVKRKDTYNIAIGGKGGHTGSYDSVQRSSLLSEKSKNKIMARDENGVPIRVDRTDERWSTGQLRGVTLGVAVMRDKDGTVVLVNQANGDSTEGLVGNTKGLVMAKNRITGEKCQVTQEEFDGNEELVGVTAGSTQSEESNQKRSAAQKGIPKPHRKLSCVKCKKVTTMGNFVRWCLPRCHNLA